MSILNSVIESTQARIVTENHDVNAINWVNGLSDPGEMIRCGYLPEIRRQEGEQDAQYAERIRPIVMALPQHQRNQIMGSAIKRMSLDVSNGKVSVMTAGELPWHGLGVNVSEAVTSEQAIKLANMDWRVEKQQLFYFDEDGTKRVCPDVYGVVRQDTKAMLGTVGSVYKPIQNVEGFEFLDGVLAEFGARYETAGAIYGGKKVWMLAHLPNQRFTINGGDTVEPYVIFTNSHDGKEAACAYPTSVRVVCANTFRTSSKGRGKGISIRHTGSVKEKIKSAQETLGLAVESFEEFRNDAESMYHTKMDAVPYFHDVLDAVLDITQAEVQQGVDAFTKAMNVTQAHMEAAVKSFERKSERRSVILNDIIERYESERCGIGSIRGTAWSCWNAVTEAANHAKIGKQSTDATLAKTRRFESIISGNADEMMQVAYTTAMQATK